MAFLYLTSILLELKKDQTSPVFMKTFKGISENDRQRRQKMAKEKYEKLKVLENFIDPSKLVIHNIPKNFDEQKLRDLCRRAANGNVKVPVRKTQRKIKTFHLMKDKESKEEVEKT